MHLGTTAYSIPRKPAALTDHQPSDHSHHRLAADRGSFLGDRQPALFQQLEACQSPVAKSAKC
jgi:hypothetical protein